MSVAFTRQRWLRERASVLGYRHTAFLILTGLEETTARYSAPFPNLFPISSHPLKADSDTKPRFTETPQPPTFLYALEYGTGARVAICRGIILSHDTRHHRCLLTHWQDTFPPSNNNHQGLHGSTSHVDPICGTELVGVSELNEGRVSRN